MIKRWLKQWSMMMNHDQAWFEKPLDVPAGFLPTWKLKDSRSETMSATMFGSEVFTKAKAFFCNV